MLVLTRRVGEEIVIGEDIRLRVVAVRGGKVSVAVSAPKSVRVDRLEVHERRREFGVAGRVVNQGGLVLASLHPNRFVRHSTASP